MHPFFPTHLRILYWEIKSRSCYILFSFLLTSIVSYQNKEFLLYLFALSYLKSDQSQKSKSIDLESIYEKSSCDFLPTSPYTPDKFDDVQSASLLHEAITCFLISLRKVQIVSLMLDGVPDYKCIVNNEDKQAAIYNYSFFSFFLEKIKANDYLNQCNNLLFLGLSRTINSNATNEELAFKKENCLLSYDDGTPPLSLLLYIDKIVNDVDIASISFIFTDVEEAFFCTILICVLFSFLAVIPFLIYQSFCFLSPSLHIYEMQKWVQRVFGVTAIWYCFIINVCSNLIPKLADFLLKFEISTSALSIIGQTKIYSYCIWTISLFVATSFIYFFFCFIFFLIINEKVKVEYFTTRRSMSRGTLLLLSAFLAPPEIQFFLALLFLFCFEAFIYFFLFYKNLRIKKSSLLFLTT